jgi:hypothetical protein
MGFGTSHVFKTTNAGASWTDKNGNLPDSPANSIALDPANPSIIYVGTDIGVFVSIDDGATWADFGTGMPNVPVVKLKTFISGGVKKLRAATYGRGMWQADLASPDVNFSGPTLSFVTVVGRTSSAQQTTLSNSTAAPIAIGSIAATGEFAATSNCPAVLQTGAACQVFVSFSPLSAGTRAGSLTLFSNASGGARTLSLSGNGVDFTLTLVRPARPTRNAANPVVVSRTSRAAQPALFDVMVSSSDAGALQGLPSSETQVALQCTGAPRGMRCAVEPPSVDLAKETTPVRVTISAVPQLGPIRLRSRSALAAGIYKLQLRALAGAISRMVELSLEIK